MINPNNLLAGVIIAGFFMFSCGESDNKSQSGSNPAPPKLEIAKLDTFPFDCKSDTMIPLGFINSDWIYENKQLGIYFRFPEGWNACENPSKGNPPIYRVGGDLSRFRDEYTHPHKLKLLVMKGQAWNKKRYLFGITKTEPINPLDERDVDMSQEPLAVAEIFYGEEFDSEESLYKKVDSTMIEYWEKDGSAAIRKMNEPMIGKVAKQSLANTVFYDHRFVMPTADGIINSETLVKKMDCIFLVISFYYRKDQDRKLIMNALQGLEIK